MLRVSTELSWIFCKLLSINPTLPVHIHQKMLNAHSTIPSTPNCGKCASGDLFLKMSFHNIQKYYTPAFPMKFIQNATAEIGGVALKARKHNVLMVFIRLPPLTKLYHMIILSSLIDWKNCIKVVGMIRAIFR